MIELFREMRKIPARDWLLMTFNLVAAGAVLVFWLVATP